MNLFLSVGICCYPFTMEPSGSVFIPFFLSRGTQRIPTEKNGSSVNGYERIGTDRNGFDLEPSGSVFIPFFRSRRTQQIPTEKNGSRLNGYERIGTDRNGFDPGKEHGVNLFLSVGICCYPFTMEPSGSVFIPFFPPEEHSGYQRKKAVQA